jgi:hypothetical protein
VPTAKELFFFDRFFDRGQKWYESQFAIHRSHRIALEVCHDYLFSESAIRRIAALYPESVLVVCLRNPLDRAVSAHRYMLRQGRTRAPFSEAVRTIPELLDHGLYGRWIQGVLEAFPREQLLVVDFERLRTNPRSTAEDFFAFLGVDSVELSPQQLQPARPASEARVQSVATAARQLANWLRRHRLERVLSPLKQSDLIEHVLFRRLQGSTAAAVTTPSDRAFAGERLRQDSALLDLLLGTQFTSTWWEMASR